MRPSFRAGRCNPSGSRHHTQQGTSASGLRTRCAEIARPRRLRAGAPPFPTMSDADGRKGQFSSFLTGVYQKDRRRPCVNCAREKSKRIVVAQRWHTTSVRSAISSVNELGTSGATILQISLRPRESPRFLLTLFFCRLPALLTRRPRRGLIFPGLEFLNSVTGPRGGRRIPSPNSSCENLVGQGKRCAATIRAVYYFLPLLFGRHLFRCVSRRISSSRRNFRSSSLPGLRAGCSSTFAFAPLSDVWGNRGQYRSVFFLPGNQGPSSTVYGPGRRSPAVREHSRR